MPCSASEFSIIACSLSLSNLHAQPGGQPGLDIHVQAPLPVITGCQPCLRPAVPQLTCPAYRAVPCPSNCLHDPKANPMHGIIIPSKSHCEGLLSIDAQSIPAICSVRIHMHHTSVWGSVQGNCLSCGPQLLSRLVQPIRQHHVPQTA